MGFASDDGFLKTIQRHPLLTAEEEKALALRVRAGDTEARERMILANMRLVISIAKNYANPELPLAELVNEGTIGLMEAVKRFDPAEECRFSTYATWWIKQALRRALLATGRAVRVPPYMLEMIAKVKSADTRLSGTLGRKPTVQEIAEEMGVPPESIPPIRQAMHVSVSASQPAAAGMDQSIADRIKDHRFPTPEEQFFHSVDASVIRQILNEIGERAAEVLRMRFGLDDREPLTLREIGARLNLTKERVRQIEGQAIRRLKRVLRSRPGFNQ